MRNRARVLRLSIRGFAWPTTPASNHRDPLTGVGTRHVFHESVETWSKNHPNDHLAVVYLDIDGFKDVNQQYGRDAGDELLIEVGRRLRAACASRGIVTRWQSDQFLVLSRLPPGTEVDHLLAVVTWALTPPITIQTHTLAISARLGTAQLPCTPAPAAADLIHRAAATVSSLTTRRRPASLPSRGSPNDETQTGPAQHHHKF